jgi:hypothetical protein
LKVISTYVWEHVNGVTTSLIVNLSEQKIIHVAFTTTTETFSRFSDKPLKPSGNPACGDQCRNVMATEKMI